MVGLKVNVISPRSSSLVFFMIWLSLVLGGCGPGGYLITKSQLAQIKIGETTKTEVQAILGKPKSIRSPEASSPQEETWTYHLAKYASDPHTGVPPIGVTSWPITRNRPRPTVIEITFAPTNLVSHIHEHRQP
jgi:hypothetical protein